MKFVTRIMRPAAAAMKRLAAALKKRAALVKQGAAVIYNSRVRPRVDRLVALARTEIIDYPDRKERARRIILLFSFLFLLDYLMYCLHTDKNIVDIFPDIPPLEQGKTVRVYLPELDGATITTERRTIPYYDSDEKTARALFEMVVKGSIFDNTSMAVPPGMFLRKVWIYGKGKQNRDCIFDMEPVELGSKMTVVKNSEALFKRALEKTVKENIPSVRRVILLEKGVPETSLWEL